MRFTSVVCTDLRARNKGNEQIYRVSSMINMDIFRGLRLNQGNTHGAYLQLEINQARLLITVAIFSIFYHARLCEAACG